MPSRNEQTILDFCDCWHHFDLEGAVSYLAKDARFTPDPNAETIVGIDAIKAKWAKYMQVMRSYDCEAVSMLSSDTHVYFERIETVGSSRGMDLVVPIVGVFEIDSQGKIAAWRDYYDTAAAPSVEGT